jgi:HD-GYP domain-containing protein (c-di-GMP phosphodiesterase class II)
MLDGSGYPDHLKGEEISDLVRVITLADIFSALVEPRAYKPALPPQEALRIMARMRGKLDHDLLKRFRAVAMLAGS